MARQSESEAFKKRERGKRKPKPVPKPKPKPKPKTKPVVTGKKGMVPSIKKPVLNLRSNKNSKLYTMQPTKFRSWFKKEHGHAYPYNVPKQSIARKKKKKKKKG